MLTRILFVLLTLRLLMPAGICACKSASPAGRMLAALLHFEPAREADELLPIGGAAEFAVGEHFESAVALQLHDLLDGFVLGGVKGFSLQISEGFPQFLRAEQAADVIGTKWRLCSLHVFLREARVCRAGLNFFEP